MASLSADGDAAVPGGRSGGVAQPRRPALPPQGDRHIQTRPGIYILYWAPWLIEGTTLGFGSRSSYWTSDIYFPLKRDGKGKRGTDRERESV